MHLVKVPQNYPKYRVHTFWVKKLNYNNGSVNIRYHGKKTTYTNDLLLWLTSFDICRGGTVARKCKFDFVLQLGICVSILFDIEIVPVRLVMCRTESSMLRTPAQYTNNQTLFLRLASKRQIRKQPSSKQC